MYSDMSIRIIAFSSPNKLDAKDLANSVLPTPVGPKNKKEPIGRFGSFNPALARRTAFDTATTASSCPITRWCNSSSKRNRRCDSSSATRDTGIPLHSETTAAISDSVTTNLDSLSFLLSSCFDAMSDSNSFSLSRRVAACSNS